MKKICILGSGVGGGILALELLKKCDAQIYIVDIDTKNEHDKKKKNQLKVKFLSNINHNKKIVYGLGGGSNSWHGVITTLDKQDLISIDKSTNYKISDSINSNWKQLSNYFPKVNELLKKTKKNFKHSLINKGDLILKKYLVNIFPLRVKKLLTYRLKNNNNLKYIDNTIAIKLNTDKLGNIISVNCIKQNKNYCIKADIFILSLGAIENPRILNQSFKNTKYYNRSVGKNLIDHPFSFISKIINKDKIIYRDNGYSSIFKKITLRYGFINSFLKSDSGKNHSIFLRPSYTKQILINRKILNQLIYKKFNLKLFSRILKSWALFKTGFGLICEKFGIGYYTNIFDVSMQFEMFHKDKSFVKLSNYKDDYGRIIPIVNYRTPNRFYKDILNMQKKIQNSLKGNSTLINFDKSKIKFESGAHYSGTCKIGSNINNSVIDQNLKYHKLKNLFICDASIFPNIGNANLFLTITLFSIRLSRYLKKRYNL